MCGMDLSSILFSMHLDRVKRSGIEVGFIKTICAIVDIMPQCCALVRHLANTNKKLDKDALIAEIRKIKKSDFRDAASLAGWFLDASVANSREENAIVMAKIGAATR